MGRLTEESQGFKPDPGNPAVRDYRGASGNVAMVEMRSRLAYRKSESGNPPPTAGAPELYPNQEAQLRPQPRQPLQGRKTLPPACSSRRRQRGRRRLVHGRDRLLETYVRVALPARSLPPCHLHIVGTEVN